MSLFWKIFLSILTLTLVAFTIGGHIVIHSSFHSTLNQEINTAKRENRALCTAMASSIHNDPHNGTISDTSLRTLAQNLQISTATGTLRFAIHSEDYSTIFSSINLTLDAESALSMPEDTCSYTILEADDRYYVMAVTKATIENQTLYLQNYIDVTDVFVKKNRTMYTFFLPMIIIAAIIVAIIAFLIYLWIVRPIKRLSKASRQIADGDFSKRVKITGHDEVSALSKDFNLMADHLEGNIDELKNAVRRQEDFVGNFAHELKTPLTSIMGYSDMLRSKRIEEEDQFAYADYIFRESKRLESLSLKLMEILVLDRDQLELRNVNILYLLENVCGAVEPIMKKSGISIVISAEDALIPMEYDLMKTVLLNLLDNSRKAIDQHGKITISGQSTREGYRLSIQDNGSGIPPEELSKIMEAFYMVDKSRAREQGGAGLGLALCSKILQLHGGTLRFESTPGVGTTAILLLKEVSE